ncbi:ligand-binding sensor domain-containing protein [Compostibacter hankyongensis]|uniref:histidine kinase n=1 Tax=Compostibacter hankyongensis TaxID=1007089 RepID=A0ABP8FM02_9BACT
METRIGDMRYKALFLIWMLGALAGIADAQTHYFTHYQVEEGLSNNAVICSLQDRRGFMWFGTKDGLNRFDGYAFKIFRHDEEHPESIGNNFIHCLYEDDSATLWIGTEQGLYRYHPETETFSLLKSCPRSEIREIKADSRGMLWFIAGLTLYCYNTATGKMKHYPPSRYFSATSISITEKGQLWVSTTSGHLEKRASSGDSFTSYDVFADSPPTTSRWIEKLYDTGQGFLLIGTSNQGIKQFDIADGTYRDILTRDSNGTTLFVRDFIRYSADEYWIGTESGIIIYNIGTGKTENLKKQYNDPYSISDNAVYTFCRDREGGIWAGTYFGGLNYYPRPYASFEKFFPRVGENSLSGNAVREICPDAYGNLWIGTEDGGLNKLNLETGTFTPFKPGGPGSLSSTNIHGLLAVGDTLWIGTFEHGLDRMQISTGRVLRHYNTGSAPGDLKNNFIYYIYRTPSGDILLASANGLFRYNRAGDDFVPIRELPDIFYTYLLQDNRGTLWAGTYREGLYYFNPSTKTSGHFAYDPADRESLNNNRVNSVFEDRRGNMWFATEGGLCKLDSGRKHFQRFTTRNGLPSNVIYAILDDNESNLWLSTSRGLTCFRPGTGVIKIYSRANGLLSDQFNYNSAYKSPGGRMYFGSVKGLISFDPETFLKNAFTPPVYITGLQIYNRQPTINAEGSPLHKAIICTDTLVLQYNQSSFSIDFAALSYTSPGNTEYAYKMDGLDKDWTYLETNRRAFFTKLLPGRYVFRVKAANSSGVWNRKETTLAIEILPPFWKSPLAYFLYFVFVSALIWYGVRSYHRSVKEKNMRRLERFEHEKEKEIYRAKIEFFTNVAHEIRTPLTLIKGPMEKVIKKAEEVPQIKNNLKIMARNTDRLLCLTSQLLDFRKAEINGFSLNFVRADIPALIRDNYLRFRPAAEEKKLSFRLHLPVARFYAYVDTEVLNKILGNLLDNALKYAENKVDICLLPEEGGSRSFTIAVKNDGYLIPPDMKEKIFETFFRIRQTAQQHGAGIGLSLSHSLAELHKGVLRLEQPESGMNVFTLTLPVHQEIEFDPLMER